MDNLECGRREMCWHCAYDVAPIAAPDVCKAVAYITKLPLPEQLTDLELQNTAYDSMVRTTGNSDWVSGAMVTAAVHSAVELIR